MSGVLDELAELCGIEPYFEDALGEKHQTSAKSKRTLLNALGYASSTDEEAARTLEELLRREWTRCVPPVIVAYVHADGMVKVPVIQPSGTDAIEWRLTTEAGDELGGRADFAGMRLLGARRVDGKCYEQRGFSVPDVPPGYHKLHVQGDAPGETTLVVTPAQCWLPEGFSKGERSWGISLQLYLLRSETNWGIGDFTDLRRFVEFSKEIGCDAVGLNPLHAMFLDEAEQASPYSPASRFLLNVLNIDVEAVPEFASSAEASQQVGAAEFQQKLAACREARQVQYAQVAELKRGVLQTLFQAFERDADPARRNAFEQFVQAQDEIFRTTCAFFALRQHFTDEISEQRDCGTWPEEFRSSHSPAVEQFEVEHADLVRLQMWLQWTAEEQFREAENAAKGMAIGLYRDMAVGAHPSGAEAWSDPGTMVSGAEVGAPPDLWNPNGQNWGLKAFHPQQLREKGYASFISLLRANMRHAGALRIDHAMELQRLYLIPSGSNAKGGGYVRFPMEDLVGILALESQRNRCMVVGEDLGTVPAGFRDRMATAHVLSYRVLLMEKRDDVFLLPKEYPPLALSTVSSHDLPTLHGWWKSHDIDTKEELKLFPTDKALRGAREERESDRKGVVEALHSEGLLPQDGGDPDTRTLIDAAHAYLARTPSLLTMVQLDDITEELEQVNFPSTTSDQRPNWARRYSRTIEELAADTRLRETGDLLAKERGREEVMQSAG